MNKRTEMYLTDEARGKLKVLAEKEKRNPSQELLTIIDFYQKHNKD